MSRQLELGLPQEAARYLAKPEEIQDAVGDVPISEWLFPFRSILSLSVHAK